MEKQKGYVDHIIYRNTENGYTVLVLYGDGEEMTCVGTYRTGRKSGSGRGVRRTSCLWNAAKGDRI